MSGDKVTHPRSLAWIHVAIIVIGSVLLLQWADLIPLKPVGGSLTVGFAYIAAALLVGASEAWTNKRGFWGWSVNFVASFVGAIVAAPIGGMVLGVLLSDGLRSLARSGGLRWSAALIGGMLFTLVGSWAALCIVNRWRPT